METGLVKWTVPLRNLAGSKKWMQESATEGLHLQEGVGEPGRQELERKIPPAVEISSILSWAQAWDWLGNEREIFLQSMGLLRECTKCISQKESATKSSGTRARAQPQCSKESSWGKMAKPPVGWDLVGNTNTPCTARGCAHQSSPDPSVQQELNTPSATGGLAAPTHHTQAIPAFPHAQSSEMHQTSKSFYFE